MKTKSKVKKAQANKADRERALLVGSIVYIEDNLDFLARRLWVGVKRGDGFFINKAKMRQMIGDMPKHIRSIGKRALRKQKEAA